MKKIGVFIDCENTSIKSFENNIEQIENLGEIMVSKAFAHNFEEQYKKWKKYKNITKLIDCPKNSTLMKSSTDMTMALNCLNDTKDYDLDIIAIMSSDSDFIPLIKMLNLLDKEIIIFGISKSANVLKNNVSNFVEINI